MRRESAAVYRARMEDGVVFLDCDGVLNVARSHTFDFEDDDASLLYDPDRVSPNAPLERRCLNQLARVCSMTGSVVVLSTSWRLHPHMRKFLVGAIEDTGSDTLQRTARFV